MCPVSDGLFGLGYGHLVHPGLHTHGVRCIEVEVTPGNENYANEKKLLDLAGNVGGTYKRMAHSFTTLMTV